MEEKETPKFLQKIYGATISRTELWITIAIVIAILAFFPG
jgi:hypothetical protein